MVSAGLSTWQLKAVELCLGSPQPGLHLEVCPPVYPFSMAVVVDPQSVLSLHKALLVVAAEYRDCNLFPDSEAPRASKGKA